MPPFMAAKSLVSASALTFVLATRGVGAIALQNEDAPAADFHLHHHFVKRKLKDYIAPTRQLRDGNEKVKALLGVRDQPSRVEREVCTLRGIAGVGTLDTLLQRGSRCSEGGMLRRKSRSGLALGRVNLVPPERQGNAQGSHELVSSVGGWGQPVVGNRRVGDPCREVRFPSELRKAHSGFGGCDPRPGGTHVRVSLACAREQ